MTGISYGQLYRWKRKNLIPEDWFIRKSTFTGQETFFPKDKILARIDRIVNMKDNLSLDEIADQFSPNPAEVTLKADDLIKRNIVTKQTWKIYEQYGTPDQLYSFEQVLPIFLFEKVLQTGLVSAEEASLLLKAMNESYKTFRGKNSELLFIRKWGVATCLIISLPSDIVFDSETQIILRLNLVNVISELKAKITTGPES